MANGKLLCFVNVFLIAFSTHAQFKNIKLEEHGSGDMTIATSLAINPRDPLNIVVATGLNTLHYTVNGGTSWKKSKISQSQGGVYGAPALLADSHGDFYFFHRSNGNIVSDVEKFDGIVVQVSTTGGETWNDEEPLDLIHSGRQVRPWPTIDSKGNFYVTWTQFDKSVEGDPNCQSNILMSTSKNGRKWGEPVYLSQTPGNCKNDDNTATGAVPAVTWDGKIFVAWANQETIFLDRSFDGGNMWLSNDINIKEQPGGWNFKVPGHKHSNGMPVLLTDKSKSNARGSLYMVWADQRNGENDTDVWFSRSVNYGDNWSTPLKISSDSTGKHQYLPTMTVDQTTGFIYIVFYDRRNYEDLQTDVYVAYSADFGNTFTNIKISETPFTPAEDVPFGDFMNIAAHKGIIIPVWTRVDEGKSSICTTVIKHADLVAATKKKE